MESASSDSKTLDMFAQRRPRAIRGGSPASDIILSDSFPDIGDVPEEENEESETESASDSEDEKDAEGKEGEELETGISLASEDEAASISFGALARAQASLLGENSKKRKRPSSDALPTNAPSRPADTNDHSAEALERKAGKKDGRKHSRLSKHAPTELSSKKAVSRKRFVVPIPKREVRDPRFESALGPINEQKVKSNYTFLDGYRDSELKALKAEIKNTKSEEEKERLKKEVLRMESQKKAQERKDAEQEVLRRHRREERAKVEGGKAPFYLKKAEVRKEALVDRYRGMKAREVDKLIERRRKKKASREKRSIPRARRVGAR